MPPLQGGVQESDYYPQLTAQYPGAFGQQLSAAAQDLILRGIAPLTGGVSQGGSAPGVNVGGSSSTATGGNASSSSNSTAIANLYESPDGAGSAQQSSPRNPIQFPTINYPQASPSAYSPLSPIPTSAPNFGGGFGGGGTASTSPQAPSFGGGAVGQPFASPQSQPSNGFSVSGGEPSQVGGAPMLQGGVTYTQQPQGGQPPTANAPWGQQLGQLAQGAYDYAQPMIQGAGDMLSNLGDWLGNAFAPAAQASPQNGLIPPPPAVTPGAAYPPPPLMQPPLPPEAAAMADGAANYAEQTADQSEAALNKLAFQMASEVAASAKSINQIKESIDQKGAAMAEALDEYGKELLRPFKTKIPITGGGSGVLIQEPMSLDQYRNELQTQVSTYNAAAASSIMSRSLKTDTDANMQRQQASADTIKALTSTSRDAGHRKAGEIYADPANVRDRARRDAVAAEAAKAQQFGAESDRLNKQIEQIDAAKDRVRKQIMERSASSAKVFFDSVQLKLDAEAKKGNLAAQVMGIEVAQKRANLDIQQSVERMGVDRGKLDATLAELNNQTVIGVAKIKQDMANATSTKDLAVQQQKLNAANIAATRLRAHMDGVASLMKGGQMTYDEAEKAVRATEGATAINQQPAQPGYGVPFGAPLGNNIPEIKSRNGELTPAQQRDFDKAVKQQEERAKKAARETFR